MVRLLSLLVLIAGALSLVGCGGSDSNPSDTDYRGLYQAAYDRANGVISFSVEGLSNGGREVFVAVTDSSQGIFLGSGLVHSDTFSVTCTSDLGRTLSVQGSFVGSGNNRFIEADTSGAFRISVTADRQNGIDTSAFSGPYGGSFRGDLQATLDGSISSNGNFTGTVFFGGGLEVPMQGSIDSTGVFSFFGEAEGVEVVIDGIAYREPDGFVFLNGLWSADDNGTVFEGEFQGSMDD